KNTPARFGFDSVEVDFFCHTWKSPQRSYRPDSHGYRSEDPFDHSEIDKMIDFLKPKKYQIDEKKDRMTQRRHYMHLVFPDLFESFYRSVHLKRQYEIENNFEYDLVVKCRYDLSFSSIAYANHSFQIPEFWWDDRMLHECYSRFVSEYNLVQLQDVYFCGSTKI